MGVFFMRTNVLKMAFYIRKDLRLTDVHIVEVFKHLGSLDLGSLNLSC